MTCNSSVLARFLFLCGHVALRQLVHLDVNILKEIKRRQAIQENENEEKRKETGKKNKNDTNVNTTKVCKKMHESYPFICSSIYYMCIHPCIFSIHSICFHIHPFSDQSHPFSHPFIFQSIPFILPSIHFTIHSICFPIHPSIHYFICFTQDTTTTETAEEEMGLTGATADDVEGEYIRKICEQDIVTGDLSCFQFYFILFIISHISMQLSCLSPLPLPFILSYRSKSSCSASSIAGLCM